MYGIIYSLVMIKDLFKNFELEHTDCILDCDSLNNIHNESDNLIQLIQESVV